VLAARSVESLQDVAAQCREEGAETLVVPTDITQESQLTHLVDSAYRQFGRIDLWAGIAGVFGYGTVDTMPGAAWNRIIEVNLLGQVRGVRAVLPRMIAQGSGRIVLVGSVYSLVASPYLSAYITSKHGLAGFADVLRQELLPTGVRVSLVMPSTVDTPIYQHAANFTGHQTRPLPPFVAPERVARAILRLSHRYRARVVVGRVQAATIPLQTLARPLVDRLTRVVINEVMIEDAPAAPTVGTLYEPDPPSNAVRGGWD
jgi:NAD(P)-dependent dehydrogenase (short-subunit alcohol dehydrogenase family)